ncbi:MAG: methionyl-tRNA formyltransferase [Desulfobacterales bacterium]
MNKGFRIVFMGTPDFSVPPLQALHNSGHEVLLVVTQPDRPRGRGRKMLPPPVKECALSLGYEVVQPESVRTQEFAERMKALHPDIFVVVAFGQLLPQNLLDIPRIASVNIHASLLPKYRGAAPIQRAVISGEKETGVTTMRMDAGMDTGDILLMEKTEILAEDTSASLHDRLSVMGAELMLKTLEGFRAGSIRPIPQNHAEATYASMLKKSDGRMDWSRKVRELDCLVRGTDPWPGAFCFFGEKRLRIWKAKPFSENTGAAPGTVLEGCSNELRVAARDGILSIEEIQGESGKRMPVKDFLRGCRIPAGTVLT